MPLLPQVGEIWLCDTSSIYTGSYGEQEWSRREHWLILKCGPVNQIDPNRDYAYYASKDYAVYYIHLETGSHGVKVFYKRDSVLDLRGNPYYKRVA